MSILIQNITKQYGEQLALNTLLHGIPQVGRVQRVKGIHWILEPQGDTDIRANLMKWSVDRGLIIKTLQKEDLSIEEAFQKLTKN